MPAMAQNSVTDGARALAHGAGTVGKGLLGGVADTGRGLLAATKNLLNINDGSLPNLSKGVQEFGLGGNINFSDDIAYNVDLSYGYFFKDNWQVGFGLGVQGEDSDFNLGLGLCTPPVGTCLFAGCAVGKLPIEKAVKTIWPFYLAIFVALMLITFVPAISLTLPGLLGS